MLLDRFTRRANFALVVLAFSTLRPLGVVATWAHAPIFSHF